MKRGYFNLLLTVSIIAQVSCTNNSPETEDVNATDTYGFSELHDSEKNLSEFVKFAASDGMMEVQLADIAMEKSTSPQVQDFAKMLREHHQKANQELQSISSSYKWEVPKEMMDSHNENVKSLQDKESGEDFDKEYLSLIEDAHEKAISKFEEFSENNRNSQAGGNSGTGSQETASSSTQGANSDLDKLPDTDAPGPGRTNTDAESSTANSEASEGNHQLQDWVQNTLPVLRSHLQQAKTIQSQTSD